MFTFVLSVSYLSLIFILLACVLVYYGTPLCFNSTYSHYYIHSVLIAALCRYDKELHSAIESELGENEECSTEKEKVLLQQIRLLREEKEHLQVFYHVTTHS